MLAFFFEACYNMRVIKRNARCFRLVTSLSSSFSPLSYMDRAQNRKALCPIHFCREKAKNKQRRCGERKTGKKGEVKGLKRGKGEVKGLKREQSGGGLPVRKPAALSFVITRPAQGGARGAGLTSRTPLRRPLRRHWRLCSSSRRRSFWRSRG